ncbi:MAG: Phosphoribosylformylglycinamidine synthase subunit PurL [Planctomycetota bacterium]
MSSTTIHRVEVRLKPGRQDPRADDALRRAKDLGFQASSVATARVYIIESSMNDAQISKAMSGLLADPVTEVANTGVAPSNAPIVEIHPLPGVMDPAAQSVQEALKALLGVDATVSTGVRYDFIGLDADRAQAAARKTLANPVIHQIVRGAWTPTSLPHGTEGSFRVRTIPVRGLSNDELQKLSREAHLFLSLDEMIAIRDEFTKLGRDPNDIELETLAQTWSEHCVHKTLKSSVHYVGPKDDIIDWSNRPGTTVQADGSVKIGNLLKHTVAAATNEMIADGLDWAWSVFKDNSGVIEFDDNWGVNIKVETHNRPSAIEPYGGAATGIGGCIRDVIGTGLGAKPIANTDVFCVADPSAFAEQECDKGKTPLPPGTLHPRRILKEVVAGVRDYGNRMGIPTVSGAVYFDNRHVGNPLVFAGCIGLIPRALIKGAAKAGDKIVALGGKTGRDGIHGATFSSAELESTASTEFAHAVQIGNAIEEKRLLDAILRARDAQGGPLYTAITDCGAGGFSSAVGEMGSTLGAEVHLENAPLKYAGLNYTEIWISEAQERMILAVPEANLPKLRAICDEEGAELSVLGTFGTPGADLILYYKGTQVGRMPMHFVHEGIPMPTRQATWNPSDAKGPSASSRPSISDALLTLLAHPNIASKHWIIRQYDHEVQGNTVVKPLCGPEGRGPSDASVIQPVAGNSRGIAVSCGLQTGIGDPKIGGDPYLMVLASIDECVRNLVCTGADPSRIAILDNFCWPGCDRTENMGMLVRAAAACYDGAKAYGTPFVSGKDSLNNQLRYKDPATGEQRVIEIPPTLLITGMGLVRNVSRCVTMDAKTPGNVLLLVGTTDSEMGGSHYARLWSVDSDCADVPVIDLTVAPATARAVAQCIQDGLVAAAHDVSDGGVLAAVAEMLIATSGAGASTTSRDNSELARLLSKETSRAALGAELSADPGMLEDYQFAFGECPGRYVLEVKPENVDKVRTVLNDHGAIHMAKLGRITADSKLVWSRADVDVAVNDLARAWLGTLDW